MVEFVKFSELYCKQGNGFQFSDQSRTLEQSVLDLISLETLLMKHTNYHDVLLPATEVADEARPHRYELGLHHVILGDRTSDQDNG